MKTKILKKAWQIDFSQIKEGFMYSARTCLAKTKSEARGELFKDIAFDELYINSIGTLVNKNNLPLQRCWHLDLVEHNGEEISRSTLEQNIRKKEHEEKFNTILNDKNITHCRILKNGYFYRDNFRGYTESDFEAGIYKKEDAISHAKNILEISIVPVNKEAYNKKLLEFFLNKYISDEESPILIKSKNFLAQKISDEFGESICEENLGEEDVYNWWLRDCTVQEVCDFLEDISEKKEQVL